MKKAAQKKLGSQTQRAPSKKKHVPETEGHTMISFPKMLEHMPVHKTATEHVFTWQTHPVFIRMLAPEKNSILNL